MDVDAFVSRLGKLYASWEVRYRAKCLWCALNRNTPSPHMYMCSPQRKSSGTMLMRWPSSLVKMMSHTPSPQHCMYVCKLSLRDYTRVCVCVCEWVGVRGDKEQKSSSVVTAFCINC